MKTAAIVLTSLMILTAGLALLPEAAAGCSPNPSVNPPSVSPTCSARVCIDSSDEVCLSVEIGDGGA